MMIPEIKIGSKIISGTAGNNNSLFESFQQTVSFTRFSDSFRLTIGDPDRELLWDIIDCEEEVSSKISGVEDKFRINSLTVTYPPYMINVTGLSLASDTMLDEVEPKVYNDTTDNAILSELFSEYSTDFEEAVNIKKFEISAGETREQAGQRIAKQNGFYLYASEGKVNKKKITSSGSSVKTYVDENILEGLNISKQTDNVKDKLILYSNDSKYQNIIEESTLTPSSVFTGETIDVSREARIRANSKDRAEMTKTIADIKFQLQPVEVLSFTVKGRDKIGLNEIATIKFNNFKLNLQMVLNEKTFIVDKNGQVKTKLVFGGLGRNLK